MPLRFLDEPGPSLGMIRDQPSWLLPPGAVYDSLNLVYDQPGIARQRMGSAALSALGATTAVGTSLGFCQSQDAQNTIEELYTFDGKAGAGNVINKSTGAATVVYPAGGVTNATIGRAVRHFGFVVFPASQSSATLPRLSFFFAGITSNSTFVNTATVAAAAGNATITLSGADTTTNIKVGSVVQIGTTTNFYLGRVVSVTDATHFKVWPAPIFTDAAITIGGMFTAQSLNDTGGACAASFQNRLLYGNVYQASVTGVQMNDRRVTYSMLPTETGSIGGVPQSGAQFCKIQANNPLNYFEVPGADPIIAMEPVNDNQVLILTSTRPVVFSGNLTTQLATTSPTVTFDISDTNIPAGCLNDLSVQRTKRGIVWAGHNGVYAWDGREPVSLTGDDKTKRVASYWQSLAADAATFVIHGSAYIRDHYIVSGTSGGATFSFACNMQNLQWTRLSGVGSDLFYGIARPTIPQQVYGARWWNQSGAAPSMTNGQVIRLESMLAPYVAGATTTDADGTAITLSLTTRTITGDPELQKLWQRGTVRHQQSSTTAAVAVTAQSKLDAADISAASVRAIGSLSNTSVLTITNATNANPIVVTTSANHGLQSDDFVDIDGVTGNTNANGRQRIVVTGNTTFSLVGMIGNGAFAGSPTCKKLTETDYLMSTLNAGQGASLKFDGAPNNWEFHGARLGALMKDSVMSA